MSRSATATACRRESSRDSAATGSHLPDDLCLFEPVGADGRPVPPGWPSERVYVTNLYNHALPLIRFEVTDEVTVSTGPARAGRRSAGSPIPRAASMTPSSTPAV